MTKQEREYNEGKKVGAVLTVSLHLILLLILAFTGFKMIYPPPAEKGILIEMPVQEIEVEQSIPAQQGPEPRAPEANPDKPVKLVQKSEAQEVGTKKKAGAATTLGNDGDVPKFEPVRKEKIDKRALFTSADNRSKNEAAQTADRVSKALKAGHPKGNTNKGNLNGEPSVRLAGRSVVGSLPAPAYTVNKEGVVVVKIMVDRYGKVTNAIPGQPGTTVSDQTLWNAAKAAALKAHFDVNASAETVQSGSITYIFRLK